jgi:hypothetical protein
MALTQVQGQMLTGSNNTTTNIQSNGTTAITLDSSQNAFFKGSYVSYNDTGYIRCDVPGYLAFQAGSSGYQFRNAGNSSTPQMTLNSSGNLLIGTTSTSVGSNSGLILEAGGTIAFSRGTTSYANVCEFNNPNGSCGSIATSGSSTQYNTSSDYRLKENIAPMTGALAKVSALKPVTYTWKVDGSSGQGFIAHELQEVVPDCVAGEKDAVETYTDEDGNEQTRIKPQGIDTSFLVATLTAAIQEQQAIITDLKARIETLEAK